MPAATGEGRRDGRAALPHPRGDLSAAVAATLLRPPGSTRATRDLGPGLEALASTAAFVHDGDAQLALWMLLELHHRGLEGVDDAWEWRPEPAAIRTALGDRLEDVVRDAVAVRLAASAPTVAARPAETLFALLGDGRRSRLARRVRRLATLEQWRDLLALKSVYQLKEADPHSWAIPRAHGAVKVALTEIQYDEYGSGDPDRQHATLFARAMAGSGLDPSYGAYVDRVPAVVLAAHNFMVVCGMQRRLLGATLGHLAMFEATSSLPHRMYAAGARRLGLGPEVVDYFDEHVTADAIHDQIAVRSMCAPFVDGDPQRAEQVLLGALGGAWLDEQTADAVLAAWDGDRSALLPAPPGRPRGGSPRLQVCPDGPVLVRGADEWVDPEGAVHALTRPVTAVCRCGASGRRPWCDGTHKVVGATDEGTRRPGRRP